jgi:hypothetical protein
MADAGWGPDGPPLSGRKFQYVPHVEDPDPDVETVPVTVLDQSDGPHVCLLSVAELVPILCAHFNLDPRGRSLVVGFAPGPEAVVADSDDPETVIPTLTLCVTHVGVK